jgi:hypothetical protein
MDDRDVLKRKKPTLSITDLVRKNHLAVLLDFDADTISSRIVKNSIPSSMMIAASRNDVEAMKIINNWGATECDYRWALENAALRGSIDAMGLLRKWRTYVAISVLEHAALGGSVAALNFLKDWNAAAHAEALTRGYNRREMQLFKLWRVPEYDIALAAAAFEGHVEAMALLKRWGASDYRLALACADGNTEAITVLKSWLLE